MNPIILASTSPYRKTQLEQLKIPFETVPSGIDEDPFKESTDSPRGLAEILSRAKAEAVAKLFPNAIVIGGDQVAEIEGEILEKPGSSEGALIQLQKLSGKSHQLWSGIAVVTPNATFVEVALNTLTMRKLSKSELETYVKIDQPWDCAGSYRVESLGISLFSSIEGKDHTAIIGVPLITLVTLLQQAGVSVLDASDYRD